MQFLVPPRGFPALYLRPFLSLLFFCFLFTTCRPKPADEGANGQKKYPKSIAEIQKGTLIEALQTESHWVDSVFNSLTPDERLAQLMIVEGYSNQGKKYEKDLLMLVKEYKVGGIIYFQGGPVRQARLTNKLQAASKVPLMLSMDAESGVGMRLDSCVQYPLPMLLGAARNDTFAYKLGAEIAYEFNRLGMHINFAPVADVNNNPKNPVISYRSFGENKEVVTSKSIAYMRGMQDNGVMAVAKHFPGHGDTDVDSHFDLPVITFKRHRLDSLELYPFRELIRTGTGGIMVAHMNVPRLDTTTKLPASLSRPIVTDLLQLGLGYQGMIFTDAMVMKGVTKYFEPGVAEVKALQAGNDVLERLVSVPTALKEIKKAINRGELSREDLDRRCKKILRAKLWLGLNKVKPIELKNLQQDLNAPHARLLNQQLAEASVTLLRNQNQVLPLNWTNLRKNRTRVATLSFGAFKPTVFQKIAEEQIQAPAFTLARTKNKARDLNRLRKALKKYNLIVISIHGRGLQPSNNLGYGKPETALINELVKSGKGIVCFFDNAYALNQFEEMKNARALLVGYQQLPAVQTAAAKVVFGQLHPRGRLPVTVNSHFKYDAGLAYTQNASVNSRPVFSQPDKKTKKPKHQLKQNSGH